MDEESHAEDSTEENQDEIVTLLNKAAETELSVLAERGYTKAKLNAFVCLSLC